MTKAKINPLIIVGVILAVILVFTMGDGLLPTPATTVLSVAPNTVEVISEGQQTVVTLRIAKVEGLYSWQVALKTEPVTEQVTFVEATLPPSHVFAGQECFGLLSSVESGQVIIGYTLLGDEPSFSGDGVLVEVKFRLSGVGNIIKFWINEEKTIFVDNELNEIPFSVAK